MLFVAISTFLQQARHTSSTALEMCKKAKLHVAFPNKSTENIYMERENTLFANKILHTRLAECHQACCATWQTKIVREEKPSNLQDHHQNLKNGSLHAYIKIEGEFKVHKLRTFLIKNIF